MRRRQLLASLAVTAAAATAPFRVGPPAQSGEAASGELLIARVRDAMLGLAPGPVNARPGWLRTGLAGALTDFRYCRYGRLADRLPLLICGGHAIAAQAGQDPEASALLAGIYTLTTRMLIKLDDQQLGWMAADRARVIAVGSGNPLIAAEASRNLAVLARRAGWHSQAMSIALAAAAHPGLRGDDQRLAAERGLLLQSAAYTAAWNGDKDAMREMTAEAAAIAASLAGPVLLRDHGGGFTPATVQLHRISADTLPANRAQPSPRRARFPPRASRPPNAAPGTGPIWPAPADNGVTGTTASAPC